MQVHKINYFYNYYDNFNCYGQNSFYEALTILFIDLTFCAQVSHIWPSLVLFRTVVYTFRMFHNKAAIFPLVSIPNIRHRWISCWQTISGIISGEPESSCGTTKQPDSMHFSTQTSWEEAFPIDTPWLSDWCIWPSIQHTEQLKSGSKSTLKSSHSLTVL